jgi:hypothetical protein
MTMIALRCVIQDPHGPDVGLNTMQGPNEPSEKSVFPCIEILRAFAEVDRSRYRKTFAASAQVDVIHVRGKNVVGRITLLIAFDRRTSRITLASFRVGDNSSGLRTEKPFTRNRSSLSE